MTRPRIERVPGDYDPRYPKGLEPEEYRELIEPDQRARLLRAASAAGAISLGAALPAQDGGAPKSTSKVRTDAVLEVLTKATSGHGGWLERTTFRRHKKKGRPEVIIPSIPISYGNSHTGVFDAERARGLVQELFVAYGLKPVRNHRLRVGTAEGRLDVYDPAVQIGTKLRGLMPEKQGMLAVPRKEEDAHALDDGEIAKLAKKGHKVHAADLQNYPLMDGDQVTPTLAYLASIVVFLNDATSGPDIDLDAILALHRVRTKLGASKAKGVDVVRADGGYLEMRADSASEIAYSFSAGTKFERGTPPKQRFGQPTWSALKAPPGPGGVLMLRTSGYPDVALRIEQDGKKPIKIDAKGAHVFLPKRFDPRRAFTVTMKLEKGKRYQVREYIELIGVPR